MTRTLAPAEGNAGTMALADSLHAPRSRRGMPPPGASSAPYLAGNLSDKYNQEVSYRGSGGSAAIREGTRLREGPAAAGTRARPKVKLDDLRGELNAIADRFREVKVEDMRQTLYRRRMMSKADEEDGEVAATAGPSNRPPDGMQSYQAPSLYRGGSFHELHRSPQEGHAHGRAAGSAWGSRSSRSLRATEELPVQQQRHAPAQQQVGACWKQLNESGPAPPAAPLVSRLPGRNALLKQAQETEGGDVVKAPGNRAQEPATKQGEQAQEAKKPWAPGYLFVWSPKESSKEEVKYQEVQAQAQGESLDDAEEEHAEVPPCPSARRSYLAPSIDRDALPSYGGTANRSSYIARSLALESAMSREESGYQGVSKMQSVTLCLPAKEEKEPATLPLSFHPSCEDGEPALPSLRSHSMQSSWCNERGQSAMLQASSSFRARSDAVPHLDSAMLQATSSFRGSYGQALSYQQFMDGTNFSSVTLNSAGSDDSLAEKGADARGSESPSSVMSSKFSSSCSLESEPDIVRHTAANDDPGSIDFTDAPLLLCTGEVQRAVQQQAALQEITETFESPPLTLRVLGPGQGIQELML